MKLVLFKKQDNIGIATLNRPKVYNAFNDQILDELAAVIAEVGRDETIRALILTGAGKAFCAGRDVTELESNPAVFHAWYRKWIPILVSGLQNLRVPTIAAINGFAVGMGCDTALACDVRIACENTRIASIWIKRGLVPAESGFWLLPRIVGLGRAAELIFSGRFVEAEEGERIGLFNKVVKASNLMDEAIKMAKSFAQNPPAGLRLSKMLMYKGLSMDMSSGQELAGSLQAILTTTEDSKEAMAAFREKRKPKFKGK
jgi:enoyl-CoA hydratase/carnithine racemase